MTIQLNSNQHQTNFGNILATILGCVFFLSLCLAFHFSLQRPAPVNVVGLFGGLIPGIAGLVFVFLVHIPNVWSERQTHGTFQAIAEVSAILFFFLLFGGMTVSGFGDLFG